MTETCSEARLETKIITELKDITKNNRTCDLNISDHCAETAPANMFRWKSCICIPCERERSRLYAKKWNAANYIKRCNHLPRIPKGRAHCRRSMVIKLDPELCDAIPPVVYFGW